MEREEVEAIIAEAQQQRKLVEVEYRGGDGTKTARMLEPFEVGPGARSKTGEPKLWGWCVDHERIEQRTLSNILSIRITDEPYDPQAHRKAFAPDPNQTRLGWEEA